MAGSWWLQFPADFEASQMRVVGGVSFDAVAHGASTSAVWNDGRRVWQDSQLFRALKSENSHRQWEQLGKIRLALNASEIFRLLVQMWCTSLIPASGKWKTEGQEYGAAWVTCDNKKVSRFFFQYIVAFIWKASKRKSIDTTDLGARIWRKKWAAWFLLWGWWECPKLRLQVLKIKLSIWK